MIKSHKAEEDDNWNLSSGSPLLSSSSSSESEPEEIAFPDSTHNQIVEFPIDSNVTSTLHNTDNANNLINVYLPNNTVITVNPANYGQIIAASQPPLNIAINGPNIIASGPSDAVIHGLNSSAAKWSICGAVALKILLGLGIILLVIGGIFLLIFAVAGIIYLLYYALVFALILGCLYICCMSMSNVATESIRSEARRNS